MCGVADLVQRGDKLVELILLEADPHVEGVVRGSRTMKFPSPRDFNPRMLHLEVIPPLVHERVGDSEVDEPEEEHGRRPEHGGSTVDGQVSSNKALYTA